MIAMWVLLACGVALIAWGVVSIRRGTLWDNDVAGEAIDADTHWFHEVFQQNFAWVNGIK